MKTPSIPCASLSLLVAFSLFTTAPSAPAQTGWGNALSFDGTNDLVQIRKFGEIAPTTEITVEFWQNASTAKTQATFGLNVDMSTNRLTAQVPWWDGQVHWYFGYTDSGSLLAYTPPVPITNSWQHFALVASQSGNFMRIYRNGLLEAQKIGMTPFVRGDYDLCLGNNDVQFFKGRLDEFRIWKVARSQAEIQAHMNHPLVGTESNLVAYWPFDEQPPGTTTKDRTRLGNTGILVNGPVWQTRSDQPLRRYPLLRAARDFSGQMVVTGDAVPGTGFRLLSATGLAGPWEAIAGTPPVQATNDVVETTIDIDPAPHFFRSELEPMIYAITNCTVTDNTATVPMEYTGLAYNLATRLYIRNLAGVRVMGQDVNTGIGGSTTTIWAKYCRLGAWFDAATPILTDVAVTHWPNWTVICPDGHPLPSATSLCPDGWQSASGTSGGFPGALTWATSDHCWDLGLCVRYQPLGQVLAQNIPYIHQLSLSLTNAGVVFPPGEVGWETGGLDIHVGCRDSRDVYVCFKKERPN